MKKLLAISVITAFVSVIPFNALCRQQIDLSGPWALDIDLPLRTYTVNLPGTLDTNGVGNVNTDQSVTTQLSRKVTYSGKATYSREVEIPKSWKGKCITLMLERTRPTTVYVDGNLAGNCDLISAPHRYDLSQWLTPGKHTITITVDNGDAIPQQIINSSHACCESTQSNWNGIVGKLLLEAKPKTHISDIQVFPDYDNNQFDVKVKVAQPLKGKDITVTIGNQMARAKMKQGIEDYVFNIPLGADRMTWSEHSPHLYDIVAEIPGTDRMSVKSGLRSFRPDGKQFAVNDTITMLRGRHDACVFPLTGYAPMDVDSWRKYFQTIKQYGLNHVRFHSWCPPEACFEAADLEGVYLQPELPIWGTFEEKEERLMNVLKADGQQIMECYGNHPSFVMFSLGNELWGELPLMQRYVEEFRTIDPRHLYANGSNTYLGWKGDLEGQDFFVTCRVGGGEGYSSHTRASFSFADADEGGYLNNTYPSTDKNFEAAVNLSKVPVVGHETGQYQIYPDYREISKYTGVFEPRNFEVFRKRLSDANLQRQARDFFEASGRWSVELYRADIEMNLRTPPMAGFQLLDLQDYPGQGTALVGILDAFMDSKGLVSPERWRQWCSDVVLLAEFPTYCINSGDDFTANIGLANYSGKPVDANEIRITLTDADGNIVASEIAPIPSAVGYQPVATFSARPVSDNATTHTLTLEIPGTDIKNDYTIWVYPTPIPADLGNVLVSTAFDENTQKALSKGANVLLTPIFADVDSATVGPLFQTDYWNYGMFKTICENNGKPVSPGTLGLLIDSNHRALCEFPTESHTNWQWYSITKNSRPLILDMLNDIDYRPIVQVIDNVERNHRLGLLMEMKVGDGKLMILMADTDEMCRTTEGQQFLNSVIDYMNSADFNPATEIPAEIISNLLNAKYDDNGIIKIRNISYD